MTKRNLSNLRSFFENELDKHVLEMDTPIEMLKPMLYSLKNGGKRLRPLLLLTMLQAQGNKHLAKGVSTALALEFIHTYSLIHDDLPAMDNDDLRRGQPTSHIKFDEATAILAGDALLTDAFGIIADDEALKSKQKVKLISLLSKAAGGSGMVDGQLNDMRAEDKSVSLEQLKAIHYAKTGKLFIFSAMAAGIIGDCSEKDRQLLIEFAEHFGVAFQIHNDLLDVQDNNLIKGRDHSSDQANHKSTYPSLLGLDDAKAALNEEVKLAKDKIKQLSSEVSSNFDLLKEFLSFIELKEDK